MSDLDGTLLNSDAKISDFSLKTLNTLMEEGISFTLATSRSMASAKGIIDGLRLKLPAVMMNGVFITNIAACEYLRINYFERPVAQKVIDAFLNSGRPPFVYRFDGGGINVQYIATTSEYEASFVEERVNKYKSFVKVKDFTVDDKIIYINGLDKPQNLDPVAAKLFEIDGISFAYYPDSYSDGFYFMEVFSSGAGKWNGVEFLKHTYGFDRVVAFGDNLNDLEMLQNSDVAVVVENGHPKVLEIADIVIPSNDSDGVCKFLLEYANGEIAL